MFSRLCLLHPLEYVRPVKQYNILISHSLQLPWRLRILVHCNGSDGLSATATALWRGSNPVTAAVSARPLGSELASVPRPKGSYGSITIALILGCTPNRLQLLQHAQIVALWCQRHRPLRAFRR